VHTLQIICVPHAVKNDTTDDVVPRSMQIPIGTISLLTLADPGGFAMRGRLRLSEDS